MDGYRRALAIFTLTANLPRIAETLYRVGLAGEDTGDADRAVESYESALEAAEAAGLEDLAGKIRARLAVLSEEDASQ